MFVFCRFGELELGIGRKYHSIIFDLYDQACLLLVCVGLGKVIDPQYTGPKGGWGAAVSGKYVVVLLDSAQSLQDLKSAYVSSSIVLVVVCLIVSLVSHNDRSWLGGAWMP